TGHKLRTNVRKVDFVHWDDPVIMEAMDAFDGVLLLPGSEPLPDAIRKRLLQHKTRLAVLDTDWTGLGFRSINLTPVHQTEDLLEHLASLGHQRIACFNTQ